MPGNPIQSLLSFIKQDWRQHAEAGEKTRKWVVEVWLLLLKETIRIDITLKSDSNGDRPWLQSSMDQAYGSATLLPPRILSYHMMQPLSPSWSWDASGNDRDRTPVTSLPPSLFLLATTTTNFTLVQSALALSVTICCYHLVSICGN